MPSLQMSIPLLPCRLLYSVLPPSVANELRHKRPVPAKRYDNVTILFSGIVGFNAFCSKHASAEGAIKIVNLLNDVYTRFDILTDSRNNPYVYKVRGSNLTMTAYQTFVYIWLSKGLKEISKGIEREEMLHTDSQQYNIKNWSGFNIHSVLCWFFSLIM